MNQKQLAKELANQLNIPTKMAETQLALTFDLIASTLAKGESVSLRRFGRLRIRHSPATRRRSPLTGELIDVAAKIAVGFTAAAELKDKVNGR